MKIKAFFLFIFCSVLLFCSCEKPALDEDIKGTGTADDKFNISFNIKRFEQVPFYDAVKYARSADIKQLCTRINFAVFNEDTKVASVNQSVSDKDFGKIAVSLPAGNYRFVVIAHNCTGNATVTNLSKIKFPNNKVTDTFYCCEEIAVDAAASYQLELRRCVAQFKLIVEDAIPEEVTKMKFVYTGGSSTFDAVNGVGSVNSHQTEERNITNSQRSGNAEFGIYTFPHVKDDVLKISIMALNSSNTVLKDLQLENVPVNMNKITPYKKAFFSTSVDTKNNTFSFVINDEWGITEYAY